MHRFLIAGYGSMGVHHAKRICALGDARVAGIYDTDPERLRAARQQGFDAFDDIHRWMSAEADCAVITTPNDTHAPLARALLESGRHVIVEKPAALNAAELLTMYEAADRAGRLLTVRQNRRWDADFLAIRRVMDENMLGEPFDFESRVHGSRGIPDGWRRRRAAGGGMLYDWGPHLIDQALCAFGFPQPERVFCHLSAIGGGEVDDGFQLTLTLPGGLRVFLEVGTCNYIPLPRFYLCGRTGTAVIDDWRQPCRVTQLLKGHEFEPGARIMSPRDASTTRSFALERPAVDEGEFLRNFCAAARGEEAPHVTRDQAMAVMRTIDAAFASAARGVPVAFSKQDGNGK